MRIDKWFHKSLSASKSTVGRSPFWSRRRFSLREYAAIAAGLLVMAGGIVLLAAGPSSVACTQTLSPGADVGSAVSNASAGAVICLDPGVYNTSPSIGSDAGVAASPLTLTSTEPNDPATINGRFVTEDTAKYLNINQLKFTWQNSTADTVAITGDHINFTHNDVSGNTGTICINPGEWNGVSLTNSLIDHNLVHDCGNPSNTDDQIHAQGIYVSSGSNNVISNNWCWNVAARCYQIRGGSNNTWHNNTSDDANWGWIFGDLTPTGNTAYDNIVGPDVKHVGPPPATPDYSYGGSVVEDELAGGTGNVFKDSCIPSPPFFKPETADPTGLVSYSNNTVVNVQFVDAATHNYNLTSAAVNTPCRSYQVQGGNPGPGTITPTVSMVAPASGTTASGTVTLSANASDSAGIASVQFELDGANLGSPVTSSPYTYSWNTASVSNGTHTLVAVATDTAGTTSTTMSVTVTVSNTTAAATTTGVAGIPVGNPYIDPTQLSQVWPVASFYTQPWRGYMQTLPATQFLGGIGVNFNPVNSSPAQDNANLKYLASIGVHAIRFEVSWGGVSPTNETQLNASSAAKVGAILAACKQYGITPTVLLNANSGGPEPSYPSLKATVVGSPKIGDSTVTVSGVSASEITVHQQGTTMGASGLSDLNGGYGNEAGNLITKVVTNGDGSLTLTLSKPLGVAPKNGTVTINYLKYLPLYAVGTSEFNNTMAGWLQYVKTVTNTVAAAGITNYSVEIWNELSFGSAFTGINNYYPSTAPLYTLTDNSEQPGGPMWELANQTTQYLKGAYGSSVNVIWGFSNTSFYHNASSGLPAGTNGESYHPYGTGSTTAADQITGDHDIKYLREGSYVPNINIALPEGIMALPVTIEQLIRGKLAPLARQTHMPSDTTNFLHYITETGVYPGAYGNFSKAENQLLKAKSILREYSLWLNKGISQFDVFAAFANSPTDAGFNMLASGSDVSGSPVTQQSQVLQNFTSQFAGAVTPSSPRNLGVTVGDVTPNDNTAAYNVFPADSATGEPALNYRQMFQFLPFQVSNHRFVISTYVMSWDLTSPPPPMGFQVDVTNVDGTNASVSYYDPIAGTTEPVTVVSRSNNDIVLNIQSVDYPRLLTIDEGSGGTTLPSNTTPPTVSVNAPANNATVSGTVALSAAASANVGTASVRFQLNGANLGPILTTSPYTYNWNTTNKPNGTYTLTADASDIDGNVTTSKPVTVTINNPTKAPPTTPPNLTAAAASGAQVNLSWGTSSGQVTSYNVYRDGSSTPFASVKSSQTNVSDTPVSPSTKYTYQVAAVNSDGIVSPLSGSVSVTTPAIGKTQPIIPTAPTGLAAAPANSVRVNLIWHASYDSLGVVGYKIYRNGSSTPLVITTASAIRYSDTPVAPSTTYTYQVAAVDVAGTTSALSAPVSVTTPADSNMPPAVPTGLAASAPSSAQVNLSWGASRGEATSYKIYRNGSSTALATVAVPTTNYTDAAVSADTTYSYQVTALNAAGKESAESAAVSVTTPKAATAPPPTVPTGLAATTTTPTSIALSWNASQATGGATLVGYHLYRNGTLIASPSGTTYTDTGLTQHTSYTYSVSAYDSSANGSAASTPLQVVTRYDGDFDNNGMINILDLSILLSHYGKSYVPGEFDHHSTVDIQDLSVLLSNYGK